MELCVGMNHPQEVEVYQENLEWNRKLYSISCLHGVGCKLDEGGCYGKGN